MPITARAIKKLRHDKDRQSANEKTRRALHKLVHSLRKSPTSKALSKVFQSLDKAAKTNVIHANKASRLKSRLSKLLKK